MLVDLTNNLVQQLTALEARLKKAPVRTTTSTSQVDGDGGVQPAAGDVAALVTSTLHETRTMLENDLARPFPSMGYRQYPRLREEIQSLSGSVTRAVARPTDPELLRMKELQQELDQAVARLNKIQTDEIAKINERMKTAPFVVTEVVK